MVQNILIFIVGVVFGFLAAWVWLDKKNQEIKKEAGRVEREVEKEREIWYGFSGFNEKMAAVKAERKRRIMEELKRVGKMRTSGVADLLDISRAGATVYIRTGF